MSSSEKMSPPETGSADINAEAASWLRRRHLENWTAENESALQGWLDETMAHRIAYWRLKAAWERADRLAALRHEKAAASHSRTGVRLAKCAAAALVLAVAGIGAWRSLAPHAPSPALYATGVGEHKTIRLTDGSQIELNTDTKIRFASESGKQTVTLLKGEAYFQIKHKPSRLFVIEANGHRITDIGTTFRVRRDEARLEVALLDGEIRFDSADARVKSVTMKPGDIIIATAHSAAVMQTPERDLKDQLGWRNGMIVFKHTTLREAAAEFNRYNTHKVVIADAAAAKLTINGTFQTGDVAAFTDAAHAVFGLRITTRNGQTVISH